MRKMAQKLQKQVCQYAKAISIKVGDKSLTLNIIFFKFLKLLLSL